MKKIFENAEIGGLCNEAKARLPYDESEWERRLADARLQRTKVLERREEVAGAPSQHTAPPNRAGARWGGVVTTAFVLGTLAGISLGASHWLQANSASLLSLATWGLGAGGTSGIPAEAPAAPNVNIPAEGPSPAIRGRGIRQENVSDRPLFAPAAPDVVNRPVPAQPIPALALASVEASPPDVTAPAPLQTPPDVRPVAQPEIGSSWWPGAKTIFVQAPPSVPGAEMQQVASALREAGFVARDPARISLAIRKTHVRYYHVSDRLAAEAVAAMLDASARDFTNFEPLPKFGTMEVWLAGRPPVRAVAAKPTPSRPAQAQARREERPNVAHEEGDRSTLSFLLLRRSGNGTDRAAATSSDRSDGSRAERGAGGASDRGSSGRGGSPESSGTTSAGRGSAEPNASDGGGKGRSGAESRSSGNSSPDRSTTSAVSDAARSATSTVSDIGRSANSKASDAAQSVSSMAGFD